MYPSSSKGLNKETKKEVFFYTPVYYPLDNFSAHQVAIWGKVFPTAEHAFQWKKFSSSAPEVAEQIFAATSPHIVKDIADRNKDKMTAEWHDQKVMVMEEILRAKADQHEDVRERLRLTGDRTIIEHSPVDSFWGIGPDGKGENNVGKIWMKIRDGLVRK